MQAQQINTHQQNGQMVDIQALIADLLKAGDLFGPVQHRANILKLVEKNTNAQAPVQRPAPVTAMSQALSAAQAKPVVQSQPTAQVRKVISMPQAQRTFQLAPKNAKPVHVPLEDKDPISRISWRRHVPYRTSVTNMAVGGTDMFFPPTEYADKVHLLAHTILNYCGNQYGRKYKVNQQVDNGVAYVFVERIA